METVFQCGSERKDGGCQPAGGSSLDTPVRVSQVEQGGAKIGRLCTGSQCFQLESSALLLRSYSSSEQ